MMMMPFICSCRNKKSPRRASARDANHMCLGDGVAPPTLEDDSSDIPAPNTPAVPGTESRGRDTASAPPLYHDNADLTASVPPRETVSKDRNTEPENTLVPSVAKAANDTGLPPAGTCTTLEHAVKSGRKRTTSTPRRAGARDANHMCLDEEVAPTTLEDDNADTPAPNTNAATGTASRERDAASAPPLFHDSADLAVAVQTRETVFKDRNTEAENTLVPSVAKTTNDTGLPPAGACTSSSSLSFVFYDLRGRLLQVVLCCGVHAFCVF